MGIVTDMDSELVKSGMKLKSHSWMLETVQLLDNVVITDVTEFC